MGLFWDWPSPQRILADGKTLSLRQELSENGYTLAPLANSNCIVTIRHDGCRDVRVEGDDPQQAADDGQLQYTGDWPVEPQRVIFGYVGRKDYVDSEGSAWRPATEFVLRLQKRADLVPVSFWTGSRVKDVGGAKDPYLPLHIAAPPPRNSRTNRFVPVLRVGS